MSTESRREENSQPNTLQESVEACPECGSNDIWPRRWKEGGRAVPQSERWTCGDCSESFPQPEERQDLRGVDP